MCAHVRTEPGVGGVDDLFVPPAADLVRQTEPLQAARPEVVGDDVSPSHQRLEHLRGAVKMREM